MHRVAVRDPRRARASTRDMVLPGPRPPRPPPPAYGSTRMPCSVPATGRRLALLLGACAAALGPPQRALAARGAAELDLEYYARSLIGMKAPPSVELLAPVEARLLDRDLAQRLLDQTALAVAAALDVPIDEVTKRAAASRPALSVEFDRLLSTGAFGAGFDASFDTATQQPQAPNNQFAFDLSLCSIYAQLTDAHLARPALSAFNARLGAALLEALRPRDALRGVGSPKTFGGVSQGVRELLGRLKAAGYVRSFSVDDSDADEVLWSQ